MGVRENPGGGWRSGRWLGGKDLKRDRGLGGSSGVGMGLKGGLGSQRGAQGSQRKVRGLCGVSEAKSCSTAVVSFSFLKWSWRGVQGGH